MKLKVIVEEFFDKKEQKYVRQEKEPVIERDEDRALQLIKAGVCEELDEKEDKPEAEPVPEEETEADQQECEEPKPAKGRKKK